MSANKSKGTNPAVWLFNYFRESREEMKKITWPSKQETVKYSIIVVALCLILAFFFAGLDYVLSLGLEKLIALKK